MAEPKGFRRGLPARSSVSTASDRRFRRSNVKPGKGRPFRAALRRTAIISGGAVLGLAFVFWSTLSFMNAGIFQIDGVVVQGNRRLAVDEIHSLLAGINDQSLFHVDLEEYRLRLLDSPWVSDAVLWRVFPSTVQVRVTERTPLAIARLNTLSYLVDDTGVIIDAAGPQYSEFDLPIVDGLLTDDSSGALADPERVQLVERLMTDVSGRADLLKRISQVDVSNPRNAIVLLDGEPARLYLGDREFLARLVRYEESVPAVRDRLRPMDYCDLRFDRLFVGSLANK